MQFLQPWFLAALGTLAIPIIIHLFYFRRYKKVFFSSVRFLKEVKDETSARSKLKNLLVLLSRLAAISALVMAFAQPFSNKKAKEKFNLNQVGIFVDNSFSMNAMQQDVPLLSMAKQRARTIVQSYGMEDRFVILTHDFSGTSMRMVHQDEAVSMIDAIQPTPVVHTLQNAVNTLKTITSKAEGNKHFYLISDFQQSITDLPPSTDTTYTTHLIPLQSVQEKNISIDSAWFESPAQFVNRPNLLKYKIHNYGDQRVQDVRVSLKQNNQIKPLGLVSLEAGESKIDTAQLVLSAGGWQDIQLELTDYPIQFDDQLNLAFNLQSNINILVISAGSPNPNLQAAIRSLPGALPLYFTQTNLDYSELIKNNLIILDDLNTISSGLANELNEAIRQGSNVLLFPGATADVKTLNNFVSLLQAGNYTVFEKKIAPVTSINTQEFTFNEVFTKVHTNTKLPIVQGKYLRSKGARGEENLLTFSDGTPCLSKIKGEAGALYLSSSPLAEEWSDLSRSAEVFVPMLYRMALNKNQIDKLVRFIGVDDQVEIKVSKKSPDDIISLTANNQNQLIPRQRTLGNKTILDMQNEIKEAQNYKINLKDSLVGILPMNYNRTESDLKIYTKQELESTYGQYMQIIEAQNADAFESWFEDNQKGSSFWKWFVIGTLIFLLIEALLLRFWKL